MTTTIVPAEHDEIAAPATIAEYERLAIGTGEWDGTEVAFSNDGTAWAPYVFPTGYWLEPRSTARA
jgi:hypothetical protein